MKLNLDISDDISIEVTGEYYPEEKGDWEYPGSPEYFKVDNFEFTNGNIEMLIDYCDDWDLDLMSDMEDRCLEYLKQ